MKLPGKAESIGSTLERTMTSMLCFRLFAFLSFLNFLFPTGGFRSNRRMLQQLVVPRQGGSSTGRLLLRRQGGLRLQLETLCSDNREDHFQLETCSMTGRLLDREACAPTTGRLAPPWRLSQCYGWPWVLQQQGGLLECFSSTVALVRVCLRPLG